MSQSLLDEKDLDFPNTQVTKTMQSRERSHTTPSASPDIGFPGGGVPQGPQELGATGTGGGNIGTGSVPQSGEDGFAGTLRGIG